MPLVLPCHWVWDFWVVDTGSEFHIFYLKAPRSLGDPEIRHANASVGHAVSSDLSSWTFLSDAISPGSAGSWDDRAIWTGSAIQSGETWHMFYTGTSLSESGLVQRIGVATSTDLESWTKVPQPLIEADGRWYEKGGSNDWPEEAWRDPWVMEIGGTFHALITARAAIGPSDGRGVIGYATSDDLRTWDVHPPISDPGEFGHLEVPQVVRVGAEYTLVFSCEASRISRRRRSRSTSRKAGGTYRVMSDSPLGPFDIRGADLALPGSLYSGKLLQQRDSSWVWLGFIDKDELGQFVGEIADPVPAVFS